MQQVFNFYHLISYLKKELLAEAGEHKVSLKIRKDDNLPQILIGDPPGLFKMLYDLVNYSLKNSKNDPLLIDLELFSIVKREVYIDFIMNEPAMNLSEKYKNHFLHNPPFPDNSTKERQKENKLQDKDESNNTIGLKIEEVSETDSQNFILRMKLEKADHLPKDQHFHLQNLRQTEALINKNKYDHEGTKSKSPDDLSLAHESSELLYSINKLKEQSEGNENFIQSMLTLFLETTPPILEAMENNLHHNKLEELGKLAHKLKPSIDTLEIHSQTATIREIEQNAKTKRNIEQLPALIKELKEGLSKVCNQLENAKQA